MSDANDTLKKLYIAYKDAQARLDKLECARTEGLAIIGMGCRFPGGASDLPGFWKILHEGRDTITDVPPERWARDAWLASDPTTPGKMYTAKGGYLAEPVDAFDAAFFNISPREARALDPQQRLLLEVCWETFENAGLDVHWIPPALRPWSVCTSPVRACAPGSPTWRSRGPSTLS